MNLESALAVLGRLYMPASDLVPTWCERLLASALGIVLLLTVVVALLWWAWGPSGD